MGCFTSEVGSIDQLTQRAGFALRRMKLFYHLITECPCFRREREEIFLDELVDDDLKWKAKDLLKFSYITRVSMAIEGENVYIDPDTTDDDSSDGGE